MTQKSVLILGATSDMARATAHAFASAGYGIALAARSANRLEADKADLELRHNVSVTLHDFDALATETHTEFAASLDPLPDVAACFVGTMATQETNEADLDTRTLNMRSNFEGPANILENFAALFETRGSGTLIGVSSVAGERGRASNYVYGAAKAGFTAYLSGLRNRLAKKGVHVVTVLPGFVNTRMTEGLDLPAKLTAEPAEVASAILRATTRGKNVIYVRPLWRLIMLIMRSLPETIFKKTSI